VPNFHKMEKKAEECGMPLDRWLNAKGQAREAQTRGRRPQGMPSTEKKLDSWGSVKGQGDLFAETKD
jgi:hypothetical protein